MGYPDLENAEINFTDSTISYTHTDNTTIADQALTTTGAFAQYELKLNKLKVMAGLRFDHYEVRDLKAESRGTKTGFLMRTFILRLPGPDRLYTKIPPI